MKQFEYGNISIFQFENVYINSNMYIIINGANALVIDPHKNDEATNFLFQNNIKNVTILLTHEHFDHTMGLNWFKENYNTNTICAKSCSDSIDENVLYAPIFVNYIASTKDEKTKNELLSLFKKEFKPFSYKADTVFDKEYEFCWNGINIRFLNVLGHSKGSCLIFLNEKVVFSGDSILNGIHIVTKLPGGNKKEYLNTTVPVIEALNRDLTVLPGHGQPFILSDVFVDDKLNVVMN